LKKKQKKNGGQEQSHPGLFPLEKVTFRITDFPASRLKYAGNL
jgi:hypothetical protein